MAATLLSKAVSILQTLSFEEKTDVIKAVVLSTLAYRYMMLHISFDKTR